LKVARPASAGGALASRPHLHPSRCLLGKGPQPSRFIAGLSPRSPPLTTQLVSESPPPIGPLEPTQPAVDNPPGAVRACPPWPSSKTAHKPTRTADVGTAAVRFRLLSCCAGSTRLATFARREGPLAGPEQVWRTDPGFSRRDHVFRGMLACVLIAAYALPFAFGSGGLHRSHDGALRPSGADVWRSLPGSPHTDNPCTHARQ